MSREGAAGRIILVRHGESEGNVLKRFSPDTDIDLTERGVVQARDAGGRIASRFVPARIVASPYRRALRTARLIAETIQHAGEIQIEHELRERSIGELAGTPYGAMRDHPGYDPERFWEWRPPSGESLVDVHGRAVPVLERLLEHGEDIVVVSHGGTLLALCAWVEGSWARQRVADNCELLIVGRGTEGRLAVRSLDEHDQHGVAGADGERNDDATG